MLNILGSPKRLCNGLTRRDWLQVGGLGTLGLGLSDVLSLQARAGAAVSGVENLARSNSFGRAKNVILLYLFGGPSQLEMLDVKPDAAAEVRGKFKAIPTVLPGLPICEHLPNMARIMDRVTVVRSISHPWNFHGMMWATTGIPQSTIPLEESQRNPLHWPYIGSVASYLDEKQHGPKPKGSVPDNIILPFLLSSRRPAAFYARPHGSILGNRYDPIWTEFRGEATRSMRRWTFGPPEDIKDPHLGITPDSRFEIAAEAQLPPEMTLDRLDKRRSLMEQFDQQRRMADGVAARTVDQHRQAAFSLLSSSKVRTAMDIGQEPMKLRDRYGMTLFGQGALQARRLVEAGCRFVTVIWDEFGQLNSGWDTHVDHCNRMQNDLLPGLDLAFSALITDLEARGMLDDTLVAVMSEMGRTPKLQGDGRGHWGYAYTNFFAGGGVPRGAVIGKTDAIAGSVIDRKLSAKDVLLTIYHLMGVDPATTFIDRFNRPFPLVADGSLVPEMLT